MRRPSSVQPQISYDPAGNLLSDGHHSYFYDAENRLVQVDGTAGYCATGSGTEATACYVYNASGQRVRKTTANGSVDYLYDLEGHQITELSSAGAWNRGEVYAGGRHLATYTGGTGGATYFILADWLGTERVRMTASGTNCESVTSQPFGDAEVIAGSCGDPSPMHFTGQQRDPETASQSGGTDGLDDFRARYNSSNLGRFMSPDPMGGRKSDPQSLNKYSYVRNSPMSLIDPTALYVCADDPKDGSAHCASKQDQEFEKRLDKLRGSSNADVARAAAAYGAANSDNGVTVRFSDLSKGGENGHTVSTIGTDASGQLRANSDVTINSKAGGADLDAAIGHEGSHVADAKDVVASGLTENGQNIYAGQNITPYASEQRAWAVTNSILSSENESRTYSCGVNNCGLGTSVKVLGLLPGIVDQILANNPQYNQGGKPMSSTNQGSSVVNGVAGQAPRAAVPQ